MKREKVEFRNGLNVLVLEFLLLRRIEDVSFLCSVVHGAAPWPSLGSLGHAQIELLEGGVGALVGGVDGGLLVEDGRLGECVEVVVQFVGLLLVSLEGSFWLVWGSI